jgi:UDP-glucose 4-epimerase
VECVFHLAAEARIQPTLENPILAAQTNTVGTCTVLQCAKEAGVERVIYSSTSSAYGKNKNLPLLESEPNNCLNPYSVTKTSGEELCKMYYNLYGLKTIIFRYFNVYGPREPLKGPYAPLVGIFLRQYKAGEPLTVVGDGEQRRDFTHIDDVVDANIKAAEVENDTAFGKVINVGTGKNYSVNDIAKMVGGTIINVPERKGEARETLASNILLKQWLDCSPKNRIENYINGNR